MRTNEERISALHERVGDLNRERKNRRFSSICVTSVAVCIGLLIAMGFLIPNITENSSAANTASSMNASIFADSNVLGYIVIAILAFLLGVTVTVFCFRLKKWMDEKDPGDSE